MFSTPDGLFQWEVMRFRLTNAPAFFVELMNRVFKGILNKIMVVFVDDMLIFSKDRKENEDHLRQVLGTLRNNKLKAKFLKFHFWREEIRFLGHVVSKDGIAADPTKIVVVQDWKVPKNAMEVRSFLGLRAIIGSLSRTSQKYRPH